MKLIIETSSQDLSAAALAFSTTHSGNARLLQVLLHSSVAITETVTVSITRTAGANYTTVLVSQALTAASDFVFRPSGDCILEQGDKVTVACTDSNDTGTVYLTVQMEALP